MSTSPRPIEILLVEDNPGDVELTREALEEGKVRNMLHVARDGEEALAYLRNEAPDRPRPDLVLLDLNLPKVDGHEVLRQMKEDPTLRAIPVVVLTTSESATDIARSYEHHASAFVSKPVSLEDFIRTVQSLESFWLTVVRYPPRRTSQP